jgi:hypothetical protein
MDALSSVILGVWLPVAYIVHGIVYKKINPYKFSVFLLILFLLAMNWLYIGRIQNVHIIGLGVLAVFLFPPNLRTGTTFVQVGIIATLILLIKCLLEYDENTRSFLLFGPNTDAAILIIILTPILYSKNKFGIMLYLGLTSIAFLSTQSRSALTLIMPVIFLILPFSQKYLLSNVKENINIASSIFIFILSVLITYLIYENTENLYILSGFDLESRWNLASYASDIDRLTSFLTAREVAFKSWSSILFGADILPSITTVTNVVHSEIFSILFGGGLILFLPISVLLMLSIFRTKNRFSIIYVFFYLIASGFSTSILSFPFLFMVNSFLNKIDNSNLKTFK